MLVSFRSALTSRLVFVNPALVRSVMDGSQAGQVRISFDEQHSVTVRGTITEVAENLAGTPDENVAPQEQLEPAI